MITFISKYNFLKAILSILVISLASCASQNSVQKNAPNCILPENLVLEHVDLRSNSHTDLIFELGHGNVKNLVFKHYLIADSHKLYIIFFDTITSNLDNYIYFNSDQIESVRLIYTDKNGLHDLEGAWINFKQKTHISFQKTKDQLIIEVSSPTQNQKMDKQKKLIKHKNHIKKSAKLQN